MSESDESQQLCHRHLAVNMSAQIWLYFITFFAIFVSLKPGNVTSLSCGKNTTKHPSFEVVIEGNRNASNNAVNLCHDQVIKPALTRIQQASASLEEKISIKQECPSKIFYSFSSNTYACLSFVS